MVLGSWPQEVNGFAPTPAGAAPAPRAATPGAVLGTCWTPRPAQSTGCGRGCAAGRGVAPVAVAGRARTVMVTAATRPRRMVRRMRSPLAPSLTPAPLAGALRVAQRALPVLSGSLPGGEQ